MIINHNLAAMNTFQRLSQNEQATQKSLQKLSSGLRINNAADDAAGLAISEKMRGQIRGLNQASRNANDGISMIQTAEGALNETQSMLQRMRELAVQASSDTNTSADRTNIQAEINQLVSEIDSISTNTEFNTKKLLNGDMQRAVEGKASIDKNAKIELTSAGGATKLSALKNSAGVSLGLIAGHAAAASIDTNEQIAIDAGSATLIQEITTATGGALSFVASAAAVASIDQNGKVTGSATTKLSTVTATKTGGALTFVTGDTITVAYDKGGVATTYTVTVSANTTLQDLFADADVTADANGFKITAKSGGTANAIENVVITVKDSGGVAKADETAALNTFTETQAAEDAISADTITVSYKVGTATADTVVTITVTSDLEISALFSGDAVIGTDSNGAVTLTAKTTGAAAGITITSITVKDSTGAQKNTETTAMNAFTETQAASDVVTGDEITVTYKLGGVSVTTTLTIAVATDMDDLFGSAGAITGNSTGATLTAKTTGTTAAISDITITVTGKTSASTALSGFAETQAAVTAVAGKEANIQIGANADQSLKVGFNKMDSKSLGVDKIDVSSHSTAEAAITLIDNAVNAVSTERANMGALQNRLEHTINNLGTSSENLSSAESRIRDVDMAQEMTVFQKNNILQQAAQAMLAQANQQPQGVLQLLR